jgi:hypothetical protein
MPGRNGLDSSTQVHVVKCVWVHVAMFETPLVLL